MKFRKAKDCPSALSLEGGGIAGVDSHDSSLILKLFDGMTKFLDLFLLVDFFLTYFYRIDPKYP